MSRAAGIGSMGFLKDELPPLVKREIKTQEQLHKFIAELRRQYATERYNGKSVVVEIYRGKELQE